MLLVRIFGSVGRLLNLNSWPFCFGTETTLYRAYIYNVELFFLYIPDLSIIPGAFVIVIHFFLCLTDCALINFVLLFLLLLYFVIFRTAWFVLFQLSIQCMLWLSGFLFWKVYLTLYLKSINRIFSDMLAIFICYHSFYFSLVSWIIEFYFQKNFLVQ